MSDAQQALTQFTAKTAWKPYFPTASRPWDEARVAHLYRRAAFGPTYQQIKDGTKATPQELVEQLLEGGAGLAAFEQEVAALTPGVLDSGNPQQLKALWMYRLLYSPHPLQERMTLFWHDHFATSNAKVNDLRLMHGQVESLRKDSLASFADLLQNMAFDPAMLIWLDSNTNQKGKPNENLAREIFELFSLGVGNYTETDILEAARALTGWSVKDRQAFFDPKQFDEGDKTILSDKGPWGAGDVVRIALRQKSCSRFIVRKLFHELISDVVNPPMELLEPLAEEYRIRDYDTRWLIGTMLKSWLFFSDVALKQKIKSPVDFVVGTIRSLEGRVGPQQMADLCDTLGQSLYYPPSVKGWDGGSDWLNSTTLLHRQNLAFDLTKGKGLGTRTDPGQLIRKYNLQSREEILQFFLTLFHQGENSEAETDFIAFLQTEQEKFSSGFYPPELIQSQLARSAAHLVLTLPEFQIG